MSNKYKDKLYVKKDLFHRIYSNVPSFEDIFQDEESFYIFAFTFVLASIVGVVILSRYVKIKEAW